MGEIKVKKISLVLFIAICLSFVACGNSKNGNDGASYTVKFESNGGTPVSFEKLSTLERAPVTSRAGYIFCGWYLDPELKTPVVYPMRLEKNVTLYARWSKATMSLVCDDAAVQFDVDNDYSYKAERLITPTELDIEGLAAQGYYVRVDVIYNVYYKKEYNVPMDLGYLGAPNHDVGIVDDYDEGKIVADLPTDKEPQAESVTAVFSAEDLLDTVLRLQLMTYNLQNVVYYTDIKVSFTVQDYPEN
jgi:uncharacterized repeat protein (TIGR02543 family)